MRLYFNKTLKVCNSLHAEMIFVWWNENFRFAVSLSQYNAIYEYIADIFYENSKQLDVL